MFSPRIQQISAAKCQTIYAPVPPKEGSRDRPLEFLRNHRIVSSVTADHVRDIRYLDHTTPNLKKGPEKARVSALLLRKSGASPSAANFYIGGDGSSQPPTNAPSRAAGTAPAAGVTTPGDGGAVRAEVKFAPLPAPRGSTVRRTLIARVQSRMADELPSPHTHLLPASAPPPTTAGRASPAAQIASPGPFYSPCRGTIRLSAHNRLTYTPNRIRLSQQMTPGSADLGLTANQISEQPYRHSPIEQRASSPVPEMHSISPRPEDLNDPSLIVTGIIGGDGYVAVNESGVLPNITEDQQASSEQQQAAEQHQQPQQAQQKMKMPSPAHMRNNVRMVINDAWLPRDSPTWAFRQKWLRLFARNGANGLAYAYSAKLQNAFT